jgi:hypothetical protein
MCGHERAPRTTTVRSPRPPSELARQQRSPDHIVCSSPHPAPDPGGGGLPLQALRIRLDAQVRQSHSHAQAIRDRERPEAEQGERRIELVAHAVAKGDGLWSVPLEIRTEPELLDQRYHGSVRAEDVVVELLQPGGIQLVSDPEAAGQASGDQLPLEDRHLGAPLREPQGGGQSQRSTAEHRDASGRKTRVIGHRQRHPTALAVIRYAP